MSTDIQVNYTEATTLNADAILAGDATGEFMMTLGDCVQEYDAQITNATHEMQEIAEEKSETRTDQSTVNGWLNKDKIIDPNYGECVSLTGAEWSELVGGKDGSSAGAPGLEEKYGYQADVYGVSGSNVLVSTSYLETLSTKQQGKLDDLNSQSELKMISFQALMDSRKQALLQLSNLHSSSSEIAMEIIRNMK